MKRIVFIIPYFGKFNNYFNLFLNSCKNNPSINWLIYTDDHNNYNYPKNVTVKYTTFDEIRKKFQSKFDFEISLNQPYKLCDFKVTYGYTFYEDIKDYDFWGYCDTDMIFGNIRKFYNDSLLNKYDKIGFFGHCTVFKNDKKINELFKKKLNGEYIYKNVLSSDEGFAFDEEYHNSINDIFEAYDMKCCFEEFQANIYTKSSNFRLTHYNFNKKSYSVEKATNSFFVYDKGNLYRINKNTMEITDYLYIHMQARKMDVNTSNYNLFKIIPNSFDDIDINDIQNHNYKGIKIKHFNLHYFKHRGKNLFLKIKRMVKR